MSSVADAFTRMTPEEATALTFFQAHGWSPPAAKAMVATIVGESGPHLNTGVYQGEGGFGPAGTTWDRLGTVPAKETAAGIANWNGARAVAARDFATAHGQNPASLDTQLQFLDSEARAKGLPISSNADPAALTSQFTGQFERPAVNNGSARWARFAGGATGAGTPPAAQAPLGAMASAAGIDNAPLPPVSQPAAIAPLGSQPTPNLGDLLASIASALTRPQSRMSMSAPPTSEFGNPNLGALLYGTHPNPVLT